MNENKTVFQIRYVETPDGIRIIANGDKRLLQRMGLGPLSIMGAGRRVKHGPAHPGRRRMMRAGRGRGRRHGRGLWPAAPAPEADQQA